MPPRISPQSKKMKIADLEPADYNPRKISDSAMKGLSASIDRFGLVQPIVWNCRTERAVGGHQRLKALHAQGIEESDVIVVDLPKSEEKAAKLDRVLAPSPPAISHPRLLDLERTGTRDNRPLGKETVPHHLAEHETSNTCHSSHKIRIHCSTLMRDGHYELTNVLII